MIVLSKTGSYDSPIYKVLDLHICIYIWRILIQVYSFFYKYTCGKTDIMPIRRNSSVKQRCNKVKIFLIGWPYVQYFRPYISNIWTSSNLLHLIHLVSTKKYRFAHIIDKWNLTSLFFPPVKAVLGQSPPEENFPSVLALTLKLTQTLTPTGEGTKGNYLLEKLSGHR